MVDVSTRGKIVRRKQLLVLGAVGLAIAVASLSASYLLGPTKKSALNPNDQPKTRTLLGGNATDKDAWRVQSSAELAKMSKRLQELEQRDKERADKDKADAAKVVTAPASAPIVPPPPPPPSAPFTQIGIGGQVVPPPTRTGQMPASPVINERPHIKTIEDSSGKVAAAAGANGLAAGAGAAANNANRNGKPGGANSESGRTAKTYLPAGSFIRAALLNGLDAPTGGQSQQNPHPVLLRLEDNAQLPNGVRANLRGCFATGSGHGDLSAERAYIRLDRLSCIDEDGGAIDVAVRGYVSGEDGKTGMRGRLITKSGQVIANALFTGLLSGFGEAMRQGSMSTTLATATGAQTDTVNNAVQYGIGTGTGKAMDRISQYYMKLADKLFPIIEIDGGRVVDVILTQGVSIERK